MYARSLYDIEPERQGAILNRTADLLEKGILEPRMTKSYDLWTEIQEAHRHQETGRTIGKVALRVAV
jgi:NADPH:quinone reductase-like Zn-dependent oxidoreductase